MPTKHHFTNEFKSQHGLDYKVEIWHKTTEVTSTTEIKSGTPGFTLIYKKIKDPILGGMMPSTLTFKYLVEDATDLSNAHGILTAQNENFYIKVYRKSVDEPVNKYSLWWFGWVTSGFDGYADKAFPYVLDVKATCSLNKQLNKYNNQVDVASQSDYRDLSHPLKLFIDNYNINTITPTVYYLFAWQFNWWNQQTGTPSADVNPIRKTFYNRAAFVSDPENFPLTINNYVEEIKGVLKCFMMRTMLSSGKYHVQQVRELDTVSPSPIYSLTADGTGGELTPDISGYPSGLQNQVVIDNTASPSDSDKAVIKKGANFSIRQEAKSIRAKYIFGNNFCNIPIGLDYTAGNIALGFVAQGTTNLQLFLNVVMRQTFPLTGTGAVTPVSNQGMYMTGVLNITLKIGNKYLKRQGGTTNPMELIWTTAVSTVDFFTGSGTYYSNSLNNLYESQNSVQEFLNQFGGDYPYPFTQWENDTPSTGTAQATSRFYVPGIVLPDLGSTFGQVEFGINAANSYNLFWTNLTPFVSPFTNLSDWINLFNPSASTNLDYNTSTNSPATALTKTFDLGVVPYLSDITADEENATDDESSPIGAIYYASQSGNDQAPDVDLGDLALGTNSSSNQINTLRAKDSSNNYIETGNFRVGNTGAYISTGQLLCNEYLKSKDEPVVTLTASIISTSYEAHRTIFYEDKIGGTGARYVFGGGKFNPMDDTWSGIWYKLNLGSTPTESTTTIYNPVDPNPGGAYNMGKLAPQNNELSNYKAGFILNNMIVATTNADITAGVALAKIDTLASVAKVYNNQKLIIADKYLRNITEITVAGDKNSGVTSIDFANVTPTTNYPTGSFLLLKSNDLSNVITGGGGTPGGSNTQVQFNNSGSFGGSSNFTFDQSTNTLQLTGGIVVTDLKINGNNIKDSGANTIISSNGSGDTSIRGGVVLVESNKVRISQNLEVSGKLISPKREFQLPADGAGNSVGDVVYIGTNDGSSGGALLTPGKIYYYKSDGAWNEAQANNVNKSGPVLLGVALGTTPATDGVLLRGTVDLSVNITGTEVLGNILYLDDVNSAAATTIQPSSDGDVIRIIGYALTTGDTNKIWFNPDSTFIEYTT